MRVSKKKKKKKADGERKLTDEELEEKVRNWIHERRENMLEFQGNLS